MVIDPISRNQFQHVLARFRNSSSSRPQDACEACETASETLQRTQSTKTPQDSTSIDDHANSRSPPGGSPTTPKSALSNHRLRNSKLLSLTPTSDLNSATKPRAKQRNKNGRVAAPLLRIAAQMQKKEGRRSFRRYRNSKESGGAKVADPY